ncbi:MAG: regulator of (H+)-ATPase in vacuolar membrane [Candelina mexicana]|nr:MAG: regulator of (H+)-ATPase in vacuolar membrane [Candelina mexicana]
MREVLPGKPEAKLQALCTVQWEEKRLVAYISGNALVILSGANDIIQTIYHDGDEVLQAVAVDEVTGKIVTCFGSTLLVYQPYGKDVGALKWSLQYTLVLQSDGDEARTLSWGTSEELLVGGTSLTIFNTAQDDTAIWTKKLANPVKFAQFSYDAGLVASTGHYDRLTKIWRRLSYGSDDVRFDFTYLPHPTTVTGMHWRRPHHRNQTTDNVLYTLCADNKVRVWAATDPHGLQILQQWAEINLQESIKPRSVEPTDRLSQRYAFIIDSRDFTVATERAVQAPSNQAQAHHALEHLIEMANRSPEVCVVLDDKGHMSAWGLENVGYKARKTTSIFNIAHIEGLALPFAHGGSLGIDNAQFYNFCSEIPGAPFTVLVHYFDGRIEWLEGRLDEFLDPSSRRNRLASKAVWTGHTGNIKKIVRTASGRACISRTNTNESLVWKQCSQSLGGSLTRRSSLDISEHIHRTCLLAEGDFVVFLHHKCISLWDARNLNAIHVASCEYELEGKPLCLVILPESEGQAHIVHVATISSDMKGITWEIRLAAQANVLNTRQPQASIREFCTFNLGLKDDLAFVLPVDPAGSNSVISGFIDTFARDIAISYTYSGLLRCWTAKADTARSTVDWLVTSTVETGIDHPSLASGSSIRKTALVDSEKTHLTIWDTRGAQLEHEEHFDKQDVIQDLDWASTPDNQSILAVGFPHKVLLLSQLRYDYLNAGPAWAAIREIRIRDLTPHPIGDSTWLGDGTLVIGAGNQLFVYDKYLSASDSPEDNSRLPVKKSTADDIFGIVTRLNGSLPVFHPQFLAQSILYGKSSLVQKVITSLHKTLKYYSQGDKLDNFLGITIEDLYREPEDYSTAAKKEMRSSYVDFVDDEEPDTVTETLASSLNEKLTEVAIPQLSSQEQFHLADIIECVAMVERHRRSMDDNASRFLLFFRQHCLRKGHQAQSTQVAVSWREIVWAYHSGSQDILVDLVSRHFSGRILWEDARESGMCMWMTDTTALRAQFENIARNEYAKTYEKNPIDCSLYYLALRKKNVLVGLWRMAAWNREQGSTQKLLANNFQEDRWKTSALKNAYALLGKRRFAYAAAFFLLADRLKDAANVCTNQMQDLQLGIAICRVYGGDGCDELKELLEDKVLPQAAREGNRWLASWAFWMLNRRDMAVRALISPVYTLLESPESPGLKARSFLADDPALVVLYRQLRQKTLQTLRGASKIPPRAEWDFITHNAQLYDRMGCDFLALDLVRNWEFLRQPLQPKRALEAPFDPRKLLRRRSSLVVADLPSPKLPTEMRSGGVNKPPASVFEEPDSNSLLDNFGF